MAAPVVGPAVSSVVVGSAVVDEVGRPAQPVPHPAGAPGYIVSGGTLVSVDDTGPTAICHVEVDIPADGVKTTLPDLATFQPAAVNR